MTGGGGGCFGRRTRIFPAPGTESEYQMVEIRPNRRLRIRHINSIPRDEKFQKEMDKQLAYRRQGYPANLVTSGVLMIPKRRVVSERPQGPQQESLPNTTMPTVVENGKLSKESTFTNMSPTNTSGMHSASSVMLAMDRPEVVMQGHGKVESNNDPKGQSHTIGKAEVDHIHNSIDAGQKSNNSDDQKKSSKTDCVLFFIHGVGGSSDIWIPQLEYFANEGYEIVAPDLIGHGFSDAPNKAKSYHFDEILADIEEVFDRYCKRKNMIIGHSYGCSFAAVLGRRRTRRVSKLVLISGGGPTPLNPQPGVFTLPVCLLRCVKPCVESSFKKSAFSKKPVIPHREAAFAIPAYILRHTMNGQIWPDGDELFHNWLMCPTLLIYGLQDQLVSLQEEQDMEEAIFQSRLVVIDNASHMVMIETPHEVNKLITDFLVQSSQFAEVTSPTAAVRAPSRLSLRSTKSFHSTAATKSMR